MGSKIVIERLRDSETDSYDRKLSPGLPVADGHPRNQSQKNLKGVKRPLGNHIVLYKIGFGSPLRY